MQVSGITIGDDSHQEARHACMCIVTGGRQGVHVRLAPRSRRANERISMHRWAQIDRTDRWWRMMCSAVCCWELAGTHPPIRSIRLTRATDSSIHPSDRAKLSVCTCLLHICRLSRSARKMAPMMAGGPPLSRRLSSSPRASTAS
jgi:hypothetical protein